MGTDGLFGPAVKLARLSAPLLALRRRSQDVFGVVVRLALCFELMWFAPFPIFSATDYSGALASFVLLQRTFGLGLDIFTTLRLHRVKVMRSRAQRLMTLVHTNKIRNLTCQTF